MCLFFVVVVFVIVVFCKLDSLLNIFCGGISPRKILVCDCGIVTSSGIVLFIHKHFLSMCFEGI